MQAFYVENQILNMLGIRGMTIDGITTSTLPNMADTQQVEVSGMQYENIFEVSTPFRINTIDSAYTTTAQNIVNQTRSLASRSTSTSRTRARWPPSPRITSSRLGSRLGAYPHSPAPCQPAGLYSNPGQVSYRDPFRHTALSLGLSAYSYFDHLLEASCMCSGSVPGDGTSPISGRQSSCWHLRPRGPKTTTFQKFTDTYGPFRTPPGQNRPALV